MKQSNICKFPSSTLLDTLSVSCFVLENNPEVMSVPYLLREHRLILPTQGTGKFLLDGKSYPFHSGCLFFAFRGEEFSVEPSTPCQYLYLQFDGVRATDLFHRFSIHKNNRFFDGFDGLIPLWGESLTTASSQTIDLAAESILLYTFSRLFANLPQYDPTISKIVELSEKQFSDPTLSVATLAEVLGYNAKYLSHFFKKKMGLGYSEYLRDLRIKYAVSLFDHGIDSVKNVSLLSGFTDPLYFSSVFKKRLGVSPTDYKSNREAQENSSAEITKLP